MPLPAERPAFVQGHIADVPAKVDRPGATSARAVPFAHHLRAASWRSRRDRIRDLAGVGVHGAGGEPLSALLRRHVHLAIGPVEAQYDVVIIGGGAHGLATAYYLAASTGSATSPYSSGRTSASGGTGRNTTVLRANYKTPRDDPRSSSESFDLYAELSLELEFNLLSRPRGPALAGSLRADAAVQRERAMLNAGASASRPCSSTPSEVARALPRSSI